jgi:hypothetical protein
LKILIGFKENYNGGLEFKIKGKKKLKDKYHKLILFKVLILNCKSDERSMVINKVFPNQNKALN